jgi:small ligand-binding sensory domain FIST
VKWASSAQGGAILGENLARAAEDLAVKLEGARPHLLLAFVSGHFMEAFPYLPELLRHHVPHEVLIGCSAGGVIGGGRELENQPAIGLTAAVLPGVNLRAMQVETDALPDGDAPPGVWRDWLGVSDEASAHVLVLTDPFSTKIEPLLTGLDYALPGGAKIGGLASAGRGPGQNALFLSTQTHRSGAALLTLEGALEVDTVVAQGCRPIGDPLTITRCDRNVMLEVNHESPLKYLGHLIEELPPADRDLMRSALFLGLQMDPLQRNPQSGDFLIRNLVGIDYERGILAVGSLLQEGQVVQFHLRDQATSSVDIDRLLARCAAEPHPRPPAGALLFSCVGRGRHLYGRPDHDSLVFRRRIGDVPLGGFFCSGEIGPVSGATYAHGYTSAFALFRPRP